jgi:hypothetical protein
MTISMELQALSRSAYRKLLRAASLTFAGAFFSVKLRLYITHVCLFTSQETPLLRLVRNYALTWSVV